MRVKQLVDEDFVNYKKPSMFIGTIKCNGKCYLELNQLSSMCQNEELKKAPIITIDDDKLINRYLNNNITSAIVFGGLEPFDQIDELYSFIYKLRHIYETDDDIVIYTGYNKDEVLDSIKKLSVFKNIIVKYGRYIPKQKSVYDEILGIRLASENQYSEYIKNNEVV